MLGAAFPATLGELTVGGNATSVPPSWAAAGSRATAVAWMAHARGGRSVYSGRLAKPRRSDSLALFCLRLFVIYLSEETGEYNGNFRKGESKEVATAGMDRPEWGRSPRAGLVRRSARRGVASRSTAAERKHDALDDVMMEF